METESATNEGAEASASVPLVQDGGGQSSKAGPAPMISSKGKVVPETEAPAVYDWQVEYAAWWLAKLDKQKQKPDVFVPPPLPMPWDPAWKSAAEWIVAFKGSEWSEIAQIFKLASGPAMCRLSEKAISNIDKNGAILFGDIKVLQGASSGPVNPCFTVITPFHYCFLKCASVG
eukprot:m.400507 g.400507  ORF g.400507 m.400507 type:complete len:174 (+) comp16784_c0_seq9:1572-2093(+)